MNQSITYEIMHMDRKVAQISENGYTKILLHILCHYH